MPHIPPDFVASPGTRVVQSFSAGTTTGMKDILVAAGWGLLETSSFAGLPSYKMQSAMPSWWDHANPPVFYNAGVKCWIKGSNFGDGNRVLFQGMSMDESIVDVIGADTPFVFAANTFRVIANPFQCFARVEGSIGGGKGLIMSALHTPRSMQDRIQLVNVFLISSGRCFRNQLQDFIFSKTFNYIKHAGGEFVSRSTTPGGGTARVMCPLVDPTESAGVAGGNHPAAKIWNQSGANYGMLCPAAVGWSDPGGAPFRIKGWFYDAYLSTKGHAEGAAQTFPNGNIAEAWTNNPTEDLTLPPGTLFLMNAGP